MKDMYIEFKNSAINGDVRDAVHVSNSATGQNSKPTVEVDSWSHVIRQPKSASASTSGGHTSERCEHEEMVFVKDIDSASPSCGKPHRKVWKSSPTIEATRYRIRRSIASRTAWRTTSKLCSTAAVDWALPVESP